MANTIKLVVITMFTAFIINLLDCGESSAAPYIPIEGSGGQEIGRVIGNGKTKPKVVCNATKRRQAAAARKKPVQKPKTAHKLKPASKVDRATVNEIKAQVKKELKAELKAEQKAKHPSFEEANKEAIKGFGVGAVTGAVITPELGGTGAVPGAAVGALGGYVGYFFEHVIGDN